MHLEFLTLFGNFTIAGQENVSNSQTQQIRATLPATRDDRANPKLTARNEQTKK
jgi:hypothetical protein